MGDETLNPESGACNVCPKRSSHSPDLFAGELNVENGDTPPGDRCIDSTCWNRKADDFLNRKAEGLRNEHPDLVLLNNGEQNGVDLEEMIHTEVRNAAEVALSRKSDGNAVPALVVNGPGLGRVKWVQPVHSEMPTPVAQRFGRPAPSEAPVEKTPEEKRKPYDKRRRQVVIDAVKAKLETLAAESELTNVPELDGGRSLTAKGLAIKTLVLLAALLADHGWRNNVQGGVLTLPEPFRWDDLEGMKGHELGVGAVREAALGLCWRLERLAVAKLALRLSVGLGETTNQPHYDEAEIICAMLGFDFTALRAQAAETIPYAKLWRDDVEDDWAATNGIAAENVEAADGRGSESR